MTVASTRSPDTAGLALARRLRRLLKDVAAVHRREQDGTGAYWLLREGVEIAVDAVLGSELETLQPLVGTKLDA
jgi:hypothetical protein